MVQAANCEDLRPMIWLLRHGEAEPAAADDAARRLTGKGERQAGAAGVALAALDAGRGDFDAGALAAGRGTVLLVGHEPDFSRAIQLATGGRVELKKGGLAAISGSTLTTLLRPGQIRRIAGG